MKQKILSIVSCAATLLSAFIGLFYSYGGSPFMVENIYGKQIELFGDGIYAYNSMLRVGTTRGTDIVMIFVALLLLVCMIFLPSKKKGILLATGLQCCILYASTCSIMGLSFNRLFLVYLIQFSSSLFAFISLTSRLKNEDFFDENEYSKQHKGLATFLIIGGCSVLVWLSFIIPAMITGSPNDFIEIYTTEPTFTIDLGIILPTCIATGIGLLQKKRFSFNISSVLLTLIICVGACVIMQTVVQLRMNIVLGIGQMIGLVGSFIILGAIAIFLNVRLLKSVKSDT